MQWGPNGSMTILLASSSSRMVRSERTTGQHDSVMPPRGRSSAAEHQLPKLRTRVRFPSPALRLFPGQRVATRDALVGCICPVETHGTDPLATISKLIGRSVLVVAASSGSQRL